MENLQQALNLQQTYSSALCGHMNLIYSKLAKLEDQFEKLQRQSNTESDYVKLNTSDFDPDIDVIPEQNLHRVEVPVRDILTQFTLMPQVSHKPLKTETNRLPIPYYPRLPISLSIAPQHFRILMNYIYLNKRITVSPHKRTLQQKEQ